MARQKIKQEPKRGRPIKTYPKSPCPECGAEPEVSGGHGSWLVYCSQCRADGPIRSSRVYAIEAWDHGRGLLKK